MNSIKTTSQSLGSSNIDLSSTTSGSSSSKNSTSSTQKSSLFGKVFQWLPRSQSSRSSLSIHSSTGRDSDSSDLSAHTIQQVPSGLSKEEIEKQGWLFSVKDFETLASGSSQESIILDCSALLNQLNEYHQERTFLTSEEKLSQLNQLEIKTLNYHHQKVAYFQSIKPNSIEKENIQNQIKAAELLLFGIGFEKKNIIALETQKALLKDSPYCQKNEDQQKDIGKNNSGNMTEVTILSYKISQGDTTAERVGYFKPVGRESMRSKVGALLGIPGSSTAIANLSGRAVAVYRISQILGFSGPSPSSEDLVPGTDFALFDNKYGSFQIEAKGEHLITSEMREKTIPIDENSRNTVVVNIACGRSKKDSLILNNDFLMINADGKVCENNEPISRKRALELVKNKSISLPSGIITSYLESDLEESILQILNGDGILPLEDLKLKEPSLSVNGEKIYENNQSIDEDRLKELVRDKKIVIVEKVITSVADDIDFKNPYLQQKMSEAHLLDFLTGQVDRHAGNFIYSKKQENKWHPYLIDNDLSFPAKLDSLDLKILVGSPILKQLPRLVEGETAKKILALKQENLEVTLKENGLSDEEVASTIKRLDALKTHLNKLLNNQYEDGRVVEEWNDATYEKLMQKKDNYIFNAEEDRKVAKANIQDRVF
jgi:hypothetical protein